MHFDASESEKMMMDLITCANDICIIHGICDYLSKISKDDLENRQHTASVVLTPRVLETASLSRASAADNLSNFAWIAERAPIVESDWFANSARAAEENLLLISNKETTEAVSTERT